MRIVKNFLLIILLSISTSYASDNITLLTENKPPINFINKNGQTTGLSVELVQKMAKRLGDACKIKVVPWNKGYKDTLKNSNTAFFSTTWSIERDKLFKWVGPLLTNQVILYKKKGNPVTINTIDDAKKVKRIGTYKNDSKEHILKLKGFKNLDSAIDNISNPKKLMAGKIDLWISTAIQSGPTCKIAGINSSKIEPVLTLRKQKMYLAFSKKTKDTIVNKWQKAFNSLLKEGIVKKIQKNTMLFHRNN